MADTRRSRPPCVSAKRPSRLTSHLAAKSGELLNGNDAGALTLDGTLRADGNAIKGIAQNAEILPSRFGDDQPLALAIEQLDTELCLQGFHLVADSTLRDAQLLGGTRKALVARGRLEGLECVERWQAAKHAAHIMRKAKAGSRNDALHVGAEATMYLTALGTFAQCL